VTDLRIDLFDGCGSISGIVLCDGDGVIDLTATLTCYGSVSDIVRHMQKKRGIRS